MKESDRRAAVTAARNEITEHYIYKRLAASAKDPHNAEVLSRISEDELRHYRFWADLLGRRVGHSPPKVLFFCLLARLFGVTFAVKLMERVEGAAEANYTQMADSVPQAADMAADEDEHERELIAMIDEERLRYMGAVVLGLNDALVELTGALAGFTFALAKPRLIAVAGLITGISASLSMAGSEYLATRSEGGELSPGKAAFYTGLAYVITVALLILPYLLLANVYLCLGVMVLTALVVIAVFNFYASVAKDERFTKRFGEMAAISLGIAALSFCIGMLVRKLLPVDV